MARQVFVIGVGISVVVIDGGDDDVVIKDTASYTWLVSPTLQDQFSL